ncbi:hypothetical protein ACHAXT_006625 [Thalassiosira profunda]
MAAAPFRSHLMQQFARARTPPLALFSFGGAMGDEKRGCCDRQREVPSKSQRPPRLSSIRSSSGIAPSANNSYILQRPSSSSVANASAEEGNGATDGGASVLDNPPSAAARTFQQLISSRRTVSNFLSRPSHEDRIFLQDAITRGVECAAAAPNHKLTEPTTFHRILAPSAASERLLDIAYEVTLQRLLDGKLSGEEACRSEATRKREKWAKIPAFVVATVSGMEDQTTDASGGLYRELPYVAPATTRQLEDYASACASIQNLLPSLHSEGLGSKWATGPVVKTPAFRDLVGCGQDEMVAGLIMVGWPKRLPRMRRRRELGGDVLRDIE